MPAGEIAVVIRAGWDNGVATLADQAVVSLGSFLSTVLLTRTLSPRELGAYTLVYSAILFFNTITGALVIYPMVVRGATLDEGEMRRLTACSVALAIPLNIVLSALLVGSLAAFADLSTLAMAAGLMLAWQLQETMRRSLMARLTHRRAIVGDAVSYLGAAASCFFLALLGRLTLDTAIGVICLSYTAGWLAHLYRAGLARFSREDLLYCIRENWHTGHWLLYTNIVNIVGIQIVPWVLAYWDGLTATATLRAVTNFGMVTHPVMFSLGNLVVPSVARAGKRLGVAFRIAVTRGAQAGALLFPYFALLFAVPGTALRLAYGLQSPYIGYALAVRLVVLVYAAMLCGQIFEALLRGLERTRDIFLAQFVVIGATVAVTLPLTYWFSVTGALLGNTLAMAAVCLWYAAMLVSQLRSMRSAAGHRERRWAVALAEERK